MADQNVEELGPSNLGTLDYWETVYSDELDNFKEYGDVGEIWFGKKSTQKIIHCMDEQLKLNKDDKIIDIGCGNGMTLVELTKKGFKNLLGVDYSQKAIDLAWGILKENNMSHIDLKVIDILNIGKVELPSDFKVAHDKGTYDAISLHPENRGSKRQQYIETVHKLLLPKAYLLLTSCNWTKEEIQGHFQGYFDIIHVLPTDTFTFGGHNGNTIVQLVLQKTE